MFVKLFCRGALISAVVAVGCGEPIQAPRSTAAQPAGSPATTMSPSGEPGTAKSSANIASEPQLKPVELLESSWNELQTLVAGQTGKVVLVDVWSTACEPCMKEFPELLVLQERFPDDVVAISFDIDYAGIKNKPPSYYRERVLKFLGSQVESNVLHRMCTTSADELFDDLKLDSIPAVYVYARDGKLAKRFDSSTSVGEGVSYEKQITPFVGDLVKQAAVK
jgi:thiol-disulfide isomerase/thioredoxin